jgi:ATP-dependent Clp protease ATP-binding subunit ClpA
VFERFTDGARKTVTGARDEAVATRRSYIGTEHMLIALLECDRGPAYAVLSGAGMTADGVRAELDRLMPPAAADPLGPEDAAALRAIGIDLDAVIARVEATFGTGALREPDEPSAKRPGLFGRGRRRAGTRTNPRFTPRAKKVIELSLREALHRQDNYIGTEHILLAMLREGDGLAAQILARAGLSLHDVRTRLDRELGDAA